MPVPQEKNERRRERRVSEEVNDWLGSSDVFLQSLLDAFPLSPDIEMRAIASDELFCFPEEKRQSFLLNIDRREGGSGGLHFTALVKKPEEKKILFLDPLNLASMPNRDIFDYLSFFQQEKGYEIVKLTRAIQSEASTFCGYHALYLLLMFSAPLDHPIHRLPLQTMSTWSLRQNDCRVLENLGKILSLLAGQRQ